MVNVVALGIGVVALDGVRQRARRSARSPARSLRNDHAVLDLPSGSRTAPARSGRAVVRVTPWRDELVDRTGFEPWSVYVELFWLPVLGPSATWLYKRLARCLAASPSGFELHLADTARALGLGGSDGARSPIRRTIDRCVRFGLARYLYVEERRPEIDPEIGSEIGSSGVPTLSVRRKVDALPLRHLRRLPPFLQEQHRRWDPHLAATGRFSRSRRFPRT